jgi:hypothetical protein
MLSLVIVVLSFRCVFWRSTAYRRPTVAAFMPPRFTPLPGTLPQHEYVVATIDVKEQRLKVFLDHAQVDEFDYTMR